MKRTLLAALLLVGLMSSNVALAAPYEWVFNLNDSNGDPITVPIQGDFSPNVDHVLVYDPSTHYPSLLALNGGLKVEDGKLVINDIPESEITGLDTDLASLTSGLAGKANTTHTHLASDISNFNSAVDARIASTTQADWNQTSTSSAAYIRNKPTLGIAYDGTTQRTGAFPVFKSATVGSGIAVFNLTTDNTSSGTSTCPNGVIQDSVNAFVSDATASYQMAYAFSNSNKTVTVTTNKLTTANILTGLLGQAAGNGSAVKLSVWCY